MFRQLKVMRDTSLLRALVQNILIRYENLLLTLLADIINSLSSHFSNKCLKSQNCHREKECLDFLMVIVNIQQNQFCLSFTTCVKFISLDFTSTFNFISTQMKCSYYEEVYQELRSQCLVQPYFWNIKIDCKIIHDTFFTFGIIKYILLLTDINETCSRI